MQLIKIDVKESFNFDPVYIFTVLDAEKNKSIDFLTPKKIEVVTMTKKGIIFFTNSGARLKYRIPFWDVNVIDPLCGLVDRVIGPGCGLKLKEYCSNIRATKDEKIKFKE